MRMPPEGKPFVPPNPVCPTEQRGHIPDLSAADFDLYVNIPSWRDVAVVQGRFIVTTDPGGGKDIVSDLVKPATIELPLGSPLARKLQELTHLEKYNFGLIGSLNDVESPVVEQMRLRFCDRVANCPGIVDGECWALGAKAVQEVVGELLDVGTDKPQPPSSDNH